MTTLREEFGVEDGDGLTIKLFRSPLWSADGADDRNLAGVCE
jgi:hypothetical protein